MLKWLHDRGADLRATDKDNRTPLHRAMRPGKGKRPSREAAAFLLNTVYTPVERFVYGEAAEQDIETFSSQMADVSEEELRRTFPELGGSTIAHLLAERGCAKQLDWLAGKIPLTDLSDDHGNRLAHACAGAEEMYADPHSYKATFEVLAQRGCDLAAANEANQTCAHVIAETQSNALVVEALQVLGNLGAPLQAVDDDGCDIAMLLAQRGPTFEEALTWAKTVCVPDLKSSAGKTADDYLKSFDDSSDEGEFGDDQASTADGEDEGDAGDEDLSSIPE